MSLFILHELEVEVDFWRHASDEIAEALMEDLEWHRLWLEVRFIAPLREFTRDFIRELASRWVARIRRDEERKNLKRRRAARARCGRR